MKKWDIDSSSIGIIVVGIFLLLVVVLFVWDLLAPNEPTFGPDTFHACAELGHCAGDEYK